MIGCYLSSEFLSGINQELCQLGIEIFHNDLLAALKARVPLEMGDSQITRLTQQRLNQFRESLHGKFGDSPDLKSIDQAAGDSGELPGRYLAALRTFAWTDSMSAVLDGLTNRIISTRTVKRLLLHVFLYLLVVMAAALLGLLFFGLNVVPLIEFIREDLFLPATADRAGFEFIAWLPVVIVAIAVLLVLTLVWSIFGGATRIAMWLGGRKYVRCWSSATALRTSQLLVESGMNIEDSIQVSCELAGVDAVGVEEIQSAIGQEQPQGDKSGQAGADQNDLRSMANYMLVLAQQRLERIRFIVPVLLVTLVGGLVSLVYCTAVFSTIIDLYWDLRLSGTQ